MSSISKDIYLALSVDFSEFYNHHLVKQSYLSNAYKTISKEDDRTIQIDLLKDFSSVLLSESSLLFQEILPSIRKLNYHVISSHNYNNLNEYFFENDIKISRLWFLLCEMAGFDIDDIYVLQSTSSTRRGIDILDILRVSTPF